MTGGKEKVMLESFLAFFEKLLTTPQSASMYAEAYVEGSLALWHTVDPSGPMNTATLDRFKKFYRAFNLSEQMAPSPLVRWTRIMMAK